MKTLSLLLAVPLFAMTVSAQTPKIEPGVPLELAKWRAEHYSDIRYELDLTLEKMAPTLKGKMAVELEVRSLDSEVSQGDGSQETGDGLGSGQSGPSTHHSSLVTRYSQFPIVLDWRKISGHEKLSKVFNVKINGKRARFSEENEHLVFREGVVEGKNRIELEFESPILTSGSAITRYVDKEDGSEYIYSLFVPSDASTAFPVFDQPDLKARFKLHANFSIDWQFVANSPMEMMTTGGCGERLPVSESTSKGVAALFELSKEEFPNAGISTRTSVPDCLVSRTFFETKPISTYVFAFAAGPFEILEETGDSGKELAEPLRGAVPLAPGGAVGGTRGQDAKTIPSRVSGDINRSGSEDRVPIRLFVRKSQAHKLLPPQTADAGGDAGAPSANESSRPLTANSSQLTAQEIFRLNREAIEYLEDYFDYPFPFPKYDVVLIPEFPFGGMEHAGATFLRETSVIFPTEPTANNYISRGSVIFHEAAHQWFGDTVTMKWFDDLWLKEGFATFMAYKTMEKVLPEYDPLKVFYQRVKPAAYATDVTKGTVPIYQDIPNLNSAKSAYGAIVYQKAPSFLRQAEFFLGEDTFKQAVRSFLKDNEFSNAEWSDLVGAFEKASESELEDWADAWVKTRGLPIVRLETGEFRAYRKLGEPHDTAVIYSFSQEDALEQGNTWPLRADVLMRLKSGRNVTQTVTIDGRNVSSKEGFARFWTYIHSNPDFVADAPVLVFPNYRDYGYGIFLLDEKSREYILENIGDEEDEFLRAQMWGSLWDSVRFAELAPLDYIDLAVSKVANEKDETTISSILGRTAYAYTYYLSDDQQKQAAPKFEALLIERMKAAASQGERITYYRTLLGVARSESARSILKSLYSPDAKDLPFPVRSKDRFDIATRLIEIGDPDGAKLLEELEKTEKDDAALRWAYAAKAGFATKENKAKFWKDFTQNAEISESWIEEAFGVWNSPAHSELTLEFLDDALAELPKLKRNRKIFFVNGWLGAFIGGQKSEEALKIVNRFLEENPGMDADLRRKILENVDGLERAVKIRSKYDQ